MARGMIWAATVCSVLGCGEGQPVQAALWVRFMSQKAYLASVRCGSLGPSCCNADCNHTSSAWPNRHLGSAACACSGFD